jgi:hypothetical protein
MKQHPNTIIKYCVCRHVDLYVLARTNIQNELVCSKNKVADDDDGSLLVFSKLPSVT